MRGQAQSLAPAEQEKGPPEEGAGRACILLALRGRVKGAGSVPRTESKQGARGWRRGSCPSSCPLEAMLFRSQPGRVGGFPDPLEELGGASGL